MVWSKTHLNSWWILEKLVFEFEAVFDNAIKKKQSDSCFHFFYLNQAVWRNVQKLAYTRKYFEVDEFQLNIKKKDFLGFFSRWRCSVRFEELRKENLAEEFQESSGLLWRHLCWCLSWKQTRKTKFWNCRLTRFKQVAQQRTSYEWSTGGMEWQLEKNSCRKSTQSKVS